MLKQVINGNYSLFSDEYALQLKNPDYETIGLVGGGQDQEKISNHLLRFLTMWVGRLCLSNN